MSCERMNRDVKDFAMTRSDIQFEQMITAMRKRLRPNGARLLADRLRICVGLNYAD
jgi:hypothetical protein